MCRTQELNLSNNQIGDAGVTALAQACAAGALAQCTTLVLGGNKIGDKGIEALSEALATGAMASLTALSVDDPEHPALRAACDARDIHLF